MTTRFRRHVPILALGLTLLAAPASAQDRLCDPGDENCRDILINYIRNEKVGIDVAFWFMEDPRYTDALISRHRAGVPVRVLIDPRANATYTRNAARLDALQAAGIPMRKRLTSYILHWKMMLFHGQNVVEFSGANYSADAWKPLSTIPYENYIDEVIYFTSDSAITNSFRTKFDDHWVDTVGVGELRQHHPAAGAQLRPLHERPVAELSARGEFPHTVRERLQGREAAHRCHHVPHHRSSAHGQHPGGGRTRHSRAAHYRAGPVSAAGKDVAFVERRPVVHGRGSDQASRPRRPEPPEVGHPLRPERFAGRRPEHGHFRIVQLDQPLGHRAGRAQYLHDEARSRLVAGEPVRAQVEQHGRRRRNQGLRAAAARCPEKSRSRPRCHGCDHHAQAEVVRRSVGSSLRPLSRHELRIHGRHRVCQPRRNRVQNRNQHVQLSRCRSR